MNGIETILHDGQPLAFLVRANAEPTQTTFVTPDEANFQVGFVVYPQGGEVARHVHLPLEREIVGTSEVIFVRRGKCEVDIYSDAKELVATRELSTGDVILFLRGGQGFRMLEDTVLWEIKQGPYTGLGEKERF